MPLWPWFLGAFGLQFVVALVMQADALSYDFRQPEFSLGDHATYALAGVREYGAEEITRLPFPAGWVFMLLLMAYIPLVFPYRNLMGFGKSIVVAAESRMAWWFSKCAWVTLCVGAFWVASLTGCALATVLFGGTLNLDVHDIATLVMQCSMDRILKGPWDMIPFFVAAVLLSASLCLAQLTLSLALRPTIAFMGTIALLFASVFTSSLFLPGEYLMAVRSSCLIADGASPIWGIVFAVLLACASVALGGTLFFRKDILSKEVSE